MTPPPFPPGPPPIIPERQRGLNALAWILLGVVLLGMVLVCVVLPLVFNANNHG